MRKIRMLDFGSKTHVMGILNVTPDSFSGDGLYKDIDAALRRAEEIEKQGADILDIGGESSRPGSITVDTEEEIRRVIPVVKELSKRIKIPISVDTRKSEVAKMALSNGASIINDISGFETDPDIMSVIRDFKAKAIIMHMKGTPDTMQNKPVYDNLIEDIINSLSEKIKKAEVSGITKENIIVDPGIGFGKTFNHNLEILSSLSAFKKLDKPVMIGVSRKSFIGTILNNDPEDRTFGTAAAVAIAIKNGADIIRVHDVREMKEVAKVIDTIIRSDEKDKVNV